MKTYSRVSLFFVLSVIFFLSSCRHVEEVKADKISKYSPSDQTLHDAIVAMDRKYFDAYNTCDMQTQADIYAEDIEFFHDQGGLMTSKADLLAGIEANICGKVTRELVEGSIEVYPINNYGAVAMGYHKFHNNQEPNAESKPSKFIGFWRNEEGRWKLAKVVSLH